MLLHLDGPAFDGGLIFGRMLRVHPSSIAIEDIYCCLYYRIITYQVHTNVFGLQLVCTTVLQRTYKRFWLMYISYYASDTCPSCNRRHLLLSVLPYYYVPGTYKRFRFTACLHHSITAYIQTFLVDVYFILRLRHMSIVPMVTVGKERRTKMGRPLT